MHIPPRVIERLKRLLGPGHVLTDEASLALNGYDCSQSRHRPDAVLTVTDAARLEPLVNLLAREKIPFIPRAAATNHAGSCSAVSGGAVLNLNPLNQIYQINTALGFADAAPGAVTGDLQAALRALGYFYAPDPASEKVSTLAGNLAQNASGARCMKYGNTSDNTLCAEFITPTGQTLTLHHDAPGPDWLGLIAGSEGTLGLIKRMRVKILPAPKHVKTFLATFPSLAAGVQTVSDLVAKGLIPRCVEAMDQITTRAVEAFARAGYPTDAQALLIIELDGDLKQIKQDAQTLQTLCRANGCQTFTAARTEAEREKLWRGRRAAYSAMAALAPNVAVGDGTVPRSELPRALEKVRQIISQYGVTASLLFHAGDGNFHPQIVFDARNREQTLRVNKALHEILKACVNCGGTVSGEHGIGVEKRAVMAYQYSRETLRLMQKIKKAFDPGNLANPGKIIPVGFENKAAAADETDPAVRALAEETKTRFLQKRPSIVTGSNMRLCTQSPHILSAAPLNRILEIDKTNYTATVQAGVKIAVLCAALKELGAYAKLPAADGGTLGGLTASKAWPDFTAQLTGLQAILPNGDIVDYGGKLMKNAAGYNLCRLFAGSAGALGLITKLTFKIYAFAQETDQAPRPLAACKPDFLFRAVKKEIDPDGLFLSPFFDGGAR